jgi:hypothetical protein
MNNRSQLQSKIFLERFIVFLFIKLTLFVDETSITPYISAFRNLRVVDIFSLILKTVLNLFFNTLNIIINNSERGKYLIQNINNRNFQ